MHIWALYWNCAHTLLWSSAHLSQGLYHQTQQWLTIWDAQHISHQLMMFLTINWWCCPRQQPPYAASVTNMCLHWCSAHLFSALCSSPHRSQSLCTCVSSQMKQCLVSWDLHDDSKSADDVFTSILTCACIGFMHIWLLYWSWAHMLLWFQCASVTRSVSSDSAVIDDLGCAAYSSSTDDVLWPCCLCQQPP